MFWEGPQTTQTTTEAKKKPASTDPYAQQPQPTAGGGPQPMGTYGGINPGAEPAPAPAPQKAQDAAGTQYNAPNASPVSATGQISPTYVQTTALNSALSGRQYGGINPGGTQYSGGTSGMSYSQALIPREGGGYWTDGSRTNTTTGGARGGINPNGMYSGTQTPGIMPPLQSGGQYGGINPTMAGGGLDGLPYTGAGPQQGVPGGSGQYGGINPQGGMTQEAGTNAFQDWAKQTFGRAATPQELSYIAQQIGYQGGTLTPDMLQKAQTVAQSMGASGGGGGVDPLPGGENPADQQGVQQFQNWAQQTFGRQATPQELQQIAQEIGYQGGPITPEMMTRAQEAARRIATSQGWTGSGGGSTTTESNDRVRFDLEEDAGRFNPYNPYQFGQYSAPWEQGQFGGQAIEALSKALGNSEWSPERLARMKEIQKEQALSMRDQAQEAIGERDAVRGVSRGGAAEARQGRLQNATDTSILGAYRDIEEMGAQNRRAELLSTAGALDSALSGQMGRSVQGFGAQLQGQMAQADDNYRGWEAQFAPWEFALKKALGEQAATQDERDYRWRTGGEHSERQRQFNIQAMLEIARMMEQQRQFNEGQGFDWTKLNLGMAGF